MFAQQPLKTSSPVRESDYISLDLPPPSNGLLHRPAAHSCGRAYVITAGSGIVSFISAGVAYYADAPYSVVGPVAAVGGALLVAALCCGLSPVLPCTRSTDAS